MPNLALELASALLNAGFAIGLAHRRRWAWPLGLLGSLLGTLVMFGAKLYAESLLNFVYAALALSGWFAWGSARQVTAPNRTLAMGLAVLVMIPSSWLMYSFTDNPSPFIDSVLFASGILATWWQVQRDDWNWPLWVAINVISAGFYADRGLMAYAVYSGFMALAAVWGWRQWRMARIKTQSSNAI